MTDRISPPPGGRPLSLLPLQIVVGLILALKLCFDFLVQPLGDEAYYWLWGQHPALSYFDHPPLQAWALWAMSMIFGWNVLSLRVLTWVSLLGTFWIIALWARRLAPDDWPRYAWTGAAMYLCSPVVFSLSNLAFHDHLMMFLCFVAAHFFLSFFARREQVRPDGHRDLYLGALALGLAGLTKENAVFLGLGVGATIVFTARLRPLLRSPHLYLAGLLALAVQAPVFYWNFTHGNRSFQFNLVNRLFGSADLVWTNPIDFLALAAVAFSPFLVIGLFRLRRPRPGASDFELHFRHLALWTFAASSLGVLAISLMTYTSFFWNIVGYILVIPLLAYYFGRGWLLRLHLAYGCLLAIFLTCNFGVIPVARLFGHEDWETTVNYGWTEVADAVAAARTAHHADFLGGTRYTLASQLGFALKTLDVTSFIHREDQFEFWFDQQAHKGMSAIVVGDDAYPADATRERFSSVTLLETLPIYRFGILVHSFDIYYCEGYRPV